MCKEANETDDARPRAYMYSILFMMGMPPLLLGGFGLAFYRLSKKREAEYAEFMESEQAMRFERPGEGDAGER